MAALCVFVRVRTRVGARARVHVRGDLKILVFECALKGSY